MKGLVYSFFILLFFLGARVNAGEVASVASTGNIAKDTHLANINALLIFTSQDGLNSGLFHFTKVGVDMQIYNLPFEYQFKSDTDLNYFMVGNVGYSSVNISQDIVLPADSRLNYESQLRTYTGGLGLGVRYKFTQELSALGGLELMYSRSGVSVKEPNDAIGHAIEDFFNSNYNDNISYKILFESVYKPQLEDFNPYVQLAYNFYDTKSDFSFDKLSSFTSQSSVLSLSVGMETNELLRVDSSYLTLEGYLHASYLRGAVAESVKFKTYSKVGGVAYWYLEKDFSWMKRLFLEVSTVNSHGLEGYNVGVGFTLNY